MQWNKSKMNFCKSYHSYSTFGKWAKYFRQRVKSYFKACLLIITTTEIIFPITLEGHLNFLVCIDFLSSFFLSCSFHCFQFFINVFAHLFILAIEIFFAMSSCWQLNMCQTPWFNNTWKMITLLTYNMLTRTCDLN